VIVLDCSQWRKKGARVAGAGWRETSVLGVPLALLGGDVLVLLAFAVLGRRTHEEAVGLAAAREVAATAAPFVAGWLLAVALSARRRGGSAASFGGVAGQVASTWALAFPIAMVLRALLIGRVSPWTFYVVAGLVPLALLLAWHAVWWGATRRAAAR
jgi:Protein of unknown function (DUF3054)